MTPLLEYILEKKAEKARQREERKDAKKKKEDERRRAREEERKKRKENAERNFLEMLNEKTKSNDDNSDKPKEEKSRVRDSGNAAGPDRDRNKPEKFKDGEDNSFFFFLSIGFLTLSSDPSFPH